MSLRGRYIIDRIKRVVSSRLKMPVPPYGDPLFWEGVYQRMVTATASMPTPSPSSPDEEPIDDAFEWGGLDLLDVLEYDFRRVHIEQQEGDYAKSSRVDDLPQRTTLGKTLGVHPVPSSQDYGDEDNGDYVKKYPDGAEESDGESSYKQEPILMLGCGNSKMGEQMIDHGWRGPILQVDIAPQALELIARRTKYDSTKLQFMQEDATHLSSLRNNTIHATVDKGLIDALFCADEYDQVRDVMKSVLRVLRPGGVFCVFSFSRPEFLLPQLVPLEEHQLYGRSKKQDSWDDLEMQELERILVYRFHKTKADDYYYRQGFSEPKRVSRKRQ